MTALVERLRAATEGDRELDWDIQQELFGIEQTDFHGTPKYTGSVDAALALVERCLPGAVWHVMTDYGDLKRAKIGPPNSPSASIYRHEDRMLFAQADAATPPLAILVALLTALSEPNHE